MSSEKPCTCVKRQVRTSDGEWSRAYELMIDPSCPRHRVRTADEGQEPVNTIEEAREQAREALTRALARLVENRLGKSLAREADKDMIALRAAANAIVALLDATEHRPITDEMVEAAAGADFEFGKESMTWADWGRANPEHAEWLRTKARAILEAAEGARR